jgi:DNA-binding NarL/FixJ family response regulator
MTKIMIIDHPHWIGSISNIIQKDRNIIAAKSCNLNSALEILQNVTPDIIILELHFIKNNILEQIATLNRLAPDTKLLLTHVASVDLIPQIPDTVAGFISKSYLDEELNLAIKVLKRGHFFLSPHFTKKIIAEPQLPEECIANKTQSDSIISEREGEVLRLILQEYSNQEIAEALNISRRTVEVHKRNLLIKTECKNIVGLVLYSLNNGLLNQRSR